MNYDYFFPEEGTLRIENPVIRLKDFKRKRVADVVFRGRNVSVVEFKNCEWISSFPMIAGRCANLTTLILDDCQIDSEKLGHMADVLYKHRFLENISLKDNHLKGRGGGQALGKLLLAPYPLKDLNIDGNRLDTSGIRALAEFLNISTSLENLSAQRSYAKWDSVRPALERAIATSGTMRLIDLGESQQIKPEFVEISDEEFDAKEMNPLEIRRHLDRVLQKCKQEFEGFTANLTDDIDKLGTWVMMLTGAAPPDQPIKQLAQFLGVGSILRKGDRLIKADGWHAKEHLEAQIHFLFALLMRISIGIDRDSPKNKMIAGIDVLPMEPCELYKKIKEEIYVAMISYGAVLRLDEIKQVKAELDREQKKFEKKKNPSKQDRLEFNSKKSALDSVISKGLEKLAEKVANLVNTLKKGQELSFASGYSTHTIYLSFNKKNNHHTFFRIDNRGAGSVSHDHADGKVKPYLRRMINPNPQILSVFLERLFRAKLQKREEGLKTIYGALQEEEFSQLFKPLIGNNLPELPKQTSGNCPHASHAVGQHIRLGNELYEWVSHQAFAHISRLLTKVEGIQSKASRDLATFAKNLFENLDQIQFFKEMSEKPSHHSAIKEILKVPEEDLSEVERAIKKIRQKGKTSTSKKSV